MKILRSQGFTQPGNPNLWQIPIVLERLLIQEFLMNPVAYKKLLSEHAESVEKR